MNLGAEVRNIGVFFGGKSGEHEVSIVSGATILAHLDRAKYRVHAIGLRPDGSLASPDEARAMLPEPIPGVLFPSVDIRPAPSGRLLELTGTLPGGEAIRFDAFFPVLHGTFGEDGTMQGLLEMAEVPYVGCGVLGSSAGMDKETLKSLFRDAGLSVVPWKCAFRPEYERDKAAFEQTVEREIGFPCFVKPCRLGSSVGIAKAHDRAELGTCLAEAFRYDYKVLAEKGIDAREIECSVMGNADVQASLPGEIVPSREFYDYEAKYQDSDSRLLMPADLSPEQTENVRALAVKAFRSAGAEGYARVDFLLDKRDGTFYANEINTIPGFTAISMFPKLWNLTGLSLPALLDTLIGLALERNAWKKGLKTTR